MRALEAQRAERGRCIQSPRSRPGRYSGLGGITAFALGLACGAWAEAPAGAGGEPGGDDSAETVQESAQPGRVEEWLRKRREKAEAPGEPYGPGLVERTMLKADKGEIPNVYGWNLWGFYPRIQSIAAGSRTAFGVRFWQPDVGRSGLDVHASAFYSLADYQYYDFQVGAIPSADGALPLRANDGNDLYELQGREVESPAGLILYGSFQYRSFRELEFFGAGPDSAPETETDFLAEGPFTELIAGYQFGPNLALRVRGGFLQPEIGRGQDENPIDELFDEETAPGLTRQPDFVTGSAQLFLDLRDVPGAPHRGAMLSLEYGRFEDQDFDAYSFNRFAIDARGYIPLGTHQRVLALRAYGNFDEPDSGHRVPFYLQQSLGGPQTLRGYDNFRFKGEEVVLFQAEYRWEASPAVELAAFIDAGAVSRLDQNVELDDLKTDWGFGLRFKNWRTVFLRFEYARGDEGSRFVFNTNAVF